MSQAIPSVDVPEGESGRWRVEKFSISEEQARFENMRASFRDRRFIEPGDYTRLMCGRTVVMSDTPSEKSDHFTPVLRARGHVLVNGLGLGMVANACLLNPGVSHVTAIEISEDVIALVADHYRKKFGGRLTVVNADALTWNPPRGVRFGMVWHDIWPNICTDNLESMKALHRKYGRRAEWQGSWCREECEYASRRWG